MMIKTLKYPQKTIEDLLKTTPSPLGIFDFAYPKNLSNYGFKNILIMAYIIS